MPLFQFNNKVVGENYRPIFTVPIKESLKKLIIQYWSENPKERPTFEEIFRKLAFNLEESVYDVFEDDEEYKYYLDGVDVDEVLNYAYEVSEGEKIGENEIRELREKNEMLSKQLLQHEQLINYLKSDNKKLMKDNEEMKKNITQLFEFINGRLKETSSDHTSFREFNYTKGKEFEGIICFLHNKTGGNIHENGTVEITSNSIDGSNYPKNLGDFNNGRDSYYSKNESGAYVCFDFKDRSIQLICYSIQSGNSSPYQSTLRNWNIQVSNDGNEWICVDSQRNKPQLNGNFKIANFTVRKKLDNFYRFIRLLSTGDSWDKIETKRFGIHKIEFFGKLSNP